MQNKKTLIYSLIVIFFITFAFPVKFGFVNSAAASLQSGSSVQTPLPVLISVVQPVVNTTIQTSQSSSPVKTQVACAAGSLANGQQLVQNAASLNLNEPANCFNLEALRVAAAVGIQVVVPSVSAVKVTVLVPHLEITSPNLASATPVQSIPVLPLTFFAAGLAYALWDKKTFVKKLALKTSSLKYNLSLHQLQVMRC